MLDAVRSMRRYVEIDACGTMNAGSHNAARVLRSRGRDDLLRRSRRPAFNGPLIGVEGGLYRRPRGRVMNELRAACGPDNLHKALFERKRWD
jgi:hypothetical protein